MIIEDVLGRLPSCRNPHQIEMLEIELENAAEQLDVDQIDEAVAYAAAILGLQEAKASIATF